MYSPLEFRGSWNSETQISHIRVNQNVRKFCQNLPSKFYLEVYINFDKNVNFRSHISAICSSCMYHIWGLQRISRHLDLDSAKLLAHALASSRLNYRNSPLSGITDTDLAKFQRILNRLAWVVTKSLPFRCSVPLSNSLHCLSVKYRVHFKICLLTCKALHEEQPVYLHFFLATSLPSRSLRSNKGISLSIPRIKINASARACMSVRSDTSVATFGRRLTTYIFWLGLLPVDTSVPDGLLMLRNSCVNFTIEHWSGCCSADPGIAGDIGAIEIGLIDWLN